MNFFLHIEIFLNQQIYKFILYLQFPPPLTSIIPYTPSVRPYGQFQVENIIASKKESGRQFIADTHTIYLDRGRLLIIENVAEKEVYERIEESSIESASAILKFETLKRLPDNFEFANTLAAFDRDKLKFPLTLRSWKKGDAFQPFGMKGHKKVSDYLIDNKVPLPLKSKALVLTSNDEIIWLVGH